MPLSRTIARCLVCYPARPSVRGGTERLIASLIRELERHGIRVDTLTLPSASVSKTQVLQEALAWTALDLSSTDADTWVLATKFPSYLLDHPRKIVWLFHQYREIYDLYGGPLSSFTNEVLDHDIRESLMQLDRRALADAYRLYSISANVARRLKRYIGIDSKVVYPPSPLSGRLSSGPVGSDILTVSRLDANKRVGLLIDAVSQTENLSVRVAGDGPLRQRLEEQSRRLGVGDRITFLGEVDEPQLIRLYEGARAVFIGPVDEDYGLVTLEALEAERAVVATSDSGGVLEFIEDGVTGMVVEPEPRALARALERVSGDDELCRRLGRAGRERLGGITWDSALSELFS